MATKKIKISELTRATSLVGFNTIGYKVVNGIKTSVQLDLSEVQTAYENTVKATEGANDAAGKANKAATDARAEMFQISEEVNQMTADVRQLEATVEENEGKRENDYTKWQAAEQGRQSDELTRKTEFEQIKTDAGIATGNANTAAGNAEAKAKEAEEQAAEAKKQAEFAQQEGNKAGKYEKRITALEGNKIDGGYSEENMLYLTVDGIPVGDPIPVGSGTGGGGGSAGISCKVKPITETLLSTVFGASVRIGYSFSSIYADDGSETGDGTATYTINSQKVATEAISQGNVYFDVTKWLIAGTNTVKVTVKDSTGQSRSVAYTIDAISMSISDSYDDALVNEGVVTYRYTPIGAIAKTVHFILDGAEIATKETTDSNRQLSQVIPAQTHGTHRLVVYMTATVSGVEVRSNEQVHDLICVSEGNNTVIIASPFNQVAVQQYDRLSIPFVVYNPLASTSAVILSVDGVVLSEQTVDRTLQKWIYRVMKPGALALKIASGSVSRTFNLNVTEAGVIIEPEAADLELYLTSQNRSNNDNNREEWKSGEISSVMSGFNWKTNGWVTDGSGSTCLRVNGEAQVDIPLMLFEKDFRATGKTVEAEFLVRDVYNYDTPVISCWSGERGILITSQTAQIKSEQSNIETKFKDGERIRLAFVAEKRVDDRLLSIYVNGIKSQTFQYPETDNFMQTVPVGITIAGKDATIDIYTIRSYNNNLNRYQLLNNYIADIDDYDKKVEAFQKNDIYDAYGRVSFTKVNERIDCLVLEGDLPQYKGDKKTNKIYYYSSANGLLNWWANIKNNVQGTSSQYYPRKNYKFEFIDGLTYIESGEQADTFKVTDEVLPASIFCIKTDFAESSGAHNTGVANYADWMLKEMGILTEAQKEDPKVRTTVAGKPCVLFHKATADSEPAFVGKVNFNTDKAAEETFGFKEGDESWEFLNNTSDMALFKSADFTKWQETIESRYPDGGADTSNVKAIFDWVVSCKGNPDKFKDEYSQYFDKDMLVFYALITLILGMTDQRAKNMFLTRYRGKLWLFILYDNDTLLPINNEGLIALLYNVETHDTVNGANVWNGADSELWKLVEEAFAGEMKDMYYTMRQRNVLSYERMMDYLYTRQAGKWCEAIYNEDGYYKYEQPLIEGYLDYSQSHENPQTIKTGAYLYALQGSREMYGKWIWKNRFLYLDSKFLTGSILGDTAVFRTYTPAVWEGVEPCADLTLTAFNAMYFNVKWGSVTKSVRVGFNETKTMTAPENMQFNDTETIIYGASLIASLGDLSPLYPGTVDVSKMIRLKELVVGSGIEGYQNRNLHSLSIGENRMLKKLDVRNCPEYSDPIDLRNCMNIEEIYAQGTGITAVNLPEGGNLTKLYLPGTIANLTLKNQPKLLDAFFEIAGVAKLSTIICENTPGMNVFPIVDRCLSVKNPALNRVRLIGLNATGANLDILYKLTKLGGVDENGNNVAMAVVTGKFHAITAVDNKLSSIRAAFPELEVTYTTLKPATVTTFTFSSSQYKTITNSTFECNFEAVKINEYTYKVTADDDSNIEFTFRCDNHEDYTDTYQVSGTRTQNYSVAYIPLRKIRVQVYNQNIYPSGASVVINGEVYLTDKDGYVSIRSKQAIEGSVSSSGYTGNTFSFPTATNDTNNTVYVYAVVEVKFIVKDDMGAFVQGATIGCEGITGETNLYGECILLIGKGEYQYTVKHPNIFDYEGTVVVGTSASTINVNVILDYEILAPKENGNVQMRVTGNSVSFYVESASANYIINWGNGSTTPASGTGNKKYTYSYMADGIHEVEISNCSNVTSTSGYSSCIVAYWSIGESLIKDLTFSGCSKLKYIGNVFKNDNNRTNASNLFYGCSKLTTLDLTPLSGWTGVTTAGSMFSGCSGLTTLDLIPLSGWTGVTNVSSMFYSCRGLKTLDLTPLSGWTGVANASSMFDNCLSLTTLDLTPLSGWTGVANASNLFDNCRVLTTLDLTPLSGWTGVTTAGSMFSGCSGLTTLDLTPLSGWTGVTTAGSMFSGCSGLTTLDLTPLSGWTGVANVSYIFRNCSSLTALDLTPLSGWTGVTNVSNLFYSCSGLTTLDLTPLSGWTDVIDAGSMFSGCSGLTTLDLTPLSGWTGVTTANSLFYICSGLTTLDLTPLSGWTGVTTANSLFYICSGLTTLDLTPLSGWTEVTNASGLFYGCSGFTTLDLTPLSGWTGVTDVSEMFNFCRGLTTLDLTPLSGWTGVTGVSEMFGRCGKLLYILFGNKVPWPLSSSSFFMADNCLIYVPDESLEAYKAATNWSALADRIRPMSDFATDFPEEVTI